MLTVLVHVQVKPESIEAFKSATIENAKNSMQEPGVARFDVLQRSDDPSKFLLIEVYRTEQAPAQHKETAHYQKWRDGVAGMMAQPRSSEKFESVYFS